MPKRAFLTTKQCVKIRTWISRRRVEKHWIKVEKTPRRGGKWNFRCKMHSKLHLRILPNFSPIFLHHTVRYLHSDCCTSFLCWFGLFWHECGVWARSGTSLKIRFGLARTNGSVWTKLTVRPGSRPNRTWWKLWNVAICVYRSHIKFEVNISLYHVFRAVKLWSKVKTHH